MSTAIIWLNDHSAYELIFIRAALKTVFALSLICKTDYSDSIEKIISDLKSYT